MTDQLNLIETIAKEPKFSTFSRFMKSSNANTLLGRPGDFTVFVPTNEAFAKVPEEEMNAMVLEPGQSKLRKLLSYHIVPGRIMAANIGAKHARQSVGGDELNFADFFGIKVNGSPVQERNIEATNGVIHSLSRLLAPPPLAGEKPLGSGARALSETPPLASQSSPASAAQSPTARADNSSAVTAPLHSELPVSVPPAGKAAESSTPIS